MSNETKIKGMGSILHRQGVAFRVWAPHAQQVSVIGSFNNWEATQHPMQVEENGYWYTNVVEARVGDQYRFLLSTPRGEFKRIDPYAREVTHSVGNAIVHDPSFDWEGDDFHLAPWNKLVIYELHVGTFNDQEDVNHPGRFPTVSARLGYLKKLGINAIQIMPVGEFAGDRSWGYNPAHIFSVETAYGGPLAFKQFVKSAHRSGIAVILDVVYNHLGPSDLDLWQFDGWSREQSRWDLLLQRQIGRTRRGGIPGPITVAARCRQYILDNAFMWLEEYHVDGSPLRRHLFTFTHCSRPRQAQDLPEGWSLLQWINSQVSQRFPGDRNHDRRGSSKTTSGSPRRLGPAELGSARSGMPTSSTPSASAVITPQDEQRSLVAIRDAHLLPLQRRRLRAGHLQRIARRGGERQGARAARGQPEETPRAGTRRSVRRWPRPWCSPRRASPCSSRVRNSSREDGSETRSPIDWDRTGRVSRHRSAVSRPHPTAAQPRRLHARPLRAVYTQVYHLNDDRKVLAYQRWDKGGLGGRRCGRRQLPP